MINNTNFPDSASFLMSPLLRRDSLREQGEQVSKTPENSILEESFSVPLDMERQFDLMASKLNETIQSISSIYNEIGYSSQEITEKKSEIFQAMNDTISSFKSNLQREKTSISNECEWLRQQIRIILAMLNDNNGEKHLKLSSRGIVFDNETMYAEGCKEDVLQHMSKVTSSKSLRSDSFQLSDHTLSPTSSFTSGKLGSPFTYSRIGSRDPDLLSQGKFKTSSSGDYSQDSYARNTPNLSLLQYKSSLNSIFLEVLKAFVKVFRKFNEVNRIYWENIEMISDEYNIDGQSVLVNSIPTRQEAEEQAALIDQFNSVIEELNLTNRNYKPELRQGLSDSTPEDTAFIISSPRKKSLGTPEHDSISSNEGMQRLREINYKLVHAIRGLKMTKITNEVIVQLSKEVDITEKEIGARVTKMKEVLGSCLNLIKALLLTESDLIAIQRMQNHERDQKTSEGLFDIDTLIFIEKNPREFGLMDHHLNFVTRLTQTLQIIKDSKQKKWEQYSQACANLWEKLGENRNYTENFLKDNSSLTDLSLNNLKMELKRLYKKRAEYVDSFILDARKQISELQSKLLYSEARCKEFKYYEFDVNGDSHEKEEILDDHEAEIERLKEDYTLKEPVLSLYAQLNELLEDRKFLAESSKDSSRLLSKNSCQILLNEEKLRKKIHKNLPRVVASLKQEIVNFNDQSLSKGQLPITAGNEDMFEKVLLIEAELGQGKQRKSVSPVKARSATTRPSSPTKSNHSPSRVQKQQFLRRSPAFSEPSSRRGQNSTFPRSRLSPTQKPDSVKSSSRVETNNRRFKTNVLMPLNTSLAPTTFGGPLPTRNTSTSYSMCSRVSPLRNAGNNRPASSSLSPTKMPQRAHVVEEKENSFIEGSLRKKHVNEDTRLSESSLANSTIVGDDYSKWREERIKAINGNDFDLC